MSKEPVPHLPRRSLHADMFLCREMRNVVAVTEKLQIVPARQIRDKFQIPIRFRPAQLVIEVNDRKNDPQFTAQFKQQPQQRNGINSSGHGHTDAVSRLQKFVPPDVGKHALCQGLHGNMVHRRSRTDRGWPAQARY